MILTDEAYAFNYYLAHKEQFLTTGEDGEKSYCLNIEEIGQLNMDENMVKDIEKSVIDFKDEFGDDTQITLSKIRKDML